MTLAEMERLKVPAKNRGRERPQPQLSKRPKLEPKVRERWHLSHRERALADEIRFSCSLREVRRGKKPLYPPQDITVKSSPMQQSVTRSPTMSLWPRPKRRTLSPTYFVCTSVCNQVMMTVIRIEVSE